MGARHSTRRLFSGRGFAGMVGGRTILVPHYIFILAGYLCVCYLFTTVSFSAFALFSSFCCRFVYKKCQMLRKRLFASLVTSLSSLTWPDFLLLLPPPSFGFHLFPCCMCRSVLRCGTVGCGALLFGAVRTDLAALPDSHGDPTSERREMAPHAQQSPNPVCCAISVTVTEWSGG